MCILYVVPNKYHLRHVVSVPQVVPIKYHLRHVVRLLQVRLEILVRTHPGLGQGTSRIRICRGGKDVDMGLSLSISSSRPTRSSLVATAGCASKFW